MGRGGRQFRGLGAERGEVFLMGDFNHWSKSTHALHARGSSGIWEGFVPDIGQGALYKYHIDSHHHGLPHRQGRSFRLAAREAAAHGIDRLGPGLRVGRQRLDANRARRAIRCRRPSRSTRSISARGCASPKSTTARSPIARSRRAWPTTCKQMGFTHVELLPVMEHPFYGSWGYQTTGYFAPTSALRHAAGLHVPGRLPAPARHRRDPRLGARRTSLPTSTASPTSTAPICTSTPIRARASIPTGRRCIFNYGRTEVRSFLMSAARMFWLDKYHVDGLRVDAVASMLYLDYSRKAGRVDPEPLRRTREPGRHRLPAPLQSRKSTRNIPTCRPSPKNPPPGRWSRGPTYVGGLGFGMKWDMGWMHDTLQYFSARSDPPQVSPQPAHLPHALRLHGEFRAAALAR